MRLTVYAHKKILLISLSLFADYRQEGSCMGVRIKERLSCNSHQWSVNHWTAAHTSNETDD